MRTMPSGAVGPHPNHPLTPTNLPDGLEGAVSEVSGIRPSGSQPCFASASDAGCSPGETLVGLLAQLPAECFRQRAMMCDGLFA